MFSCLFRLSRYNDGWMNGWMAVKMATWRERKTIMSETCTYSCQHYVQTKTFMVKRHLRPAIVYMQVTYFNSAIKSDQIMESVNISPISFSTRGPFPPFYNVSSLDYMYSPLCTMLHLTAFSAWFTCFALLGNVPMKSWQKLHL